MISYVLPTHDRQNHLELTLRAIGQLPPDLHDPAGGAEVVVVDNNSRPPPRIPVALMNDIPVNVVHLPKNIGAAARNAGALRARGDWLVMLDDDSHPTRECAVNAILHAPDDVAAIGAEIFLPDGSRERGGLPEVVIGCGAAIRRNAFLKVGGYDRAFHFYAEEYDLCAKLLLNGWRVVHDRRFRVIHEKTQSRRNMNVIMRRLVRNNAWVTQRYAPKSERRAKIRETIARYRRIALRERAEMGFALGLLETGATLWRQKRSAMSAELFDRFTGLDCARKTLSSERAISRGARVAVIDEGKNAWVVHQALQELGVTITPDEREADVHVVGTLSPGPSMDAWERRTAGGQCVVSPVRFASHPIASVAEAKPAQTISMSG